MKFTREQPEGIYTIHACRPESVILNSPNPADLRDEEARIELTESFILSPGRLLPTWGANTLEQVTTANLAPISALQPEVLLLGTGEKMRFPDNTLLAALIELRIGYEVMGNAAACRTYNILAGEGRRVVAAIIIKG
ncbi:MAG: Mth938-like domain-containing protein [Gammaproteobacteria bacterium]|nr:Mth938-like domain-containing protein [Gammaproteobacteria bacterium]MCW8957771.1 Mth938-like domain-containing protein [Gammaproteobacteria bacterium]MCW8974047.1 Mth938-like domain-containing protein [Gammaproteobacteria bacterium]MCW8992867.1 Mth938-like domain-containing protein [Gammaproteobacteria bacterium]